MRQISATSFQPRPAGGTLRRSFECSVPNLIADVRLEGRPFHPIEIANAEAALLHLKHTGKFGGSLEGVLLRTEAVSSSKIEGIRSGAKKLARTAAGFADYAQGDPALSVWMHASAITAAAVILTEETTKRQMLSQQQRL